MSFEASVTRNRTADKKVRIFEADGTTPVVLAAEDVVRFKLYRRDQSDPVIDVDSAADTPNGSGIQVDQLDPAEVTLRLAQGDTAPLDPGVYDAEICVVDASETNPPQAIKAVESGVVYLLPSAGGDVGLT